jgi:acetylornithine deacetylase
MTEREKQMLVGLTRELVDIPTENNPPDGGERAAQGYLERRFSAMGLALDVFSPGDIEGFAENPAFLHDRVTKGRNNVVGTWKGRGGGRSLILAAHIDVAPREPLPWTVTEPFQSVVRDGRIYGRGACDMKGGLAGAMAALESLREAGYRPRGDVILQSVVDEEFAGGNGTIAACMRGYAAGLAVILEPSGLRVCAANVGGVMINVRIKGNPGMPYTGERIFNVAYALADLLKLVERFEEQRKAAPCPPLWEDAVQKRAVVVTKVKAGEVKPHGQLGSPMDAWAELSVQTYPGETAEGVVGELERMIGGTFGKSAEITVTPLYHYIEPSDTPAGYPGVTMLCASLEAVSGARARATAAPFPCDAFAYQKYAQTPSVIFGPVGGNLHSPDEWVDIGSLAALTDTLVDFIPNWCG